MNRKKPTTNDWKPSYWRPHLSQSINDNQRRGQSSRRNPNNEAGVVHPKRFKEDDLIRRKALQKYTPSIGGGVTTKDQQRFPQSSKVLSVKNTQKSQLWISKLQNTVENIKNRFRYKVNQIFDTSSSSSLSSSASDTDSLVVSQSSLYNPNRQGLVAFSSISPIAAVFSSLITSLSITSLAFTRELVFGTALDPGEEASSTTLTTLRAPLVSAVYALCEVLSSGIRFLLNIPGGGCGIGVATAAVESGNSSDYFVQKLMYLSCISLLYILII